MIDREELDTEEAREARRYWLVKVRPTASEDMLSSDEYEREYLKPHIVTTDNIKDVERDHSVLFCPACRQEAVDGLTKAQKLHISYEQDPLNNYPAVVTTRCCGCRYVEHIPIIADPVSPQDQQDASKYRMGMTATEINIHTRQAYGMGPAGIAGAAAQQQMDLYRRMQLESLQGQVSPPMIVKPPDVIGFGHKLAQQIWRDIDDANEIRAKAAQYRVQQEAQKAMTVPPPYSGNLVWYDEASKLDYGAIKKAKDMLDKQDVPSDVKRSMIEKYWNKYRSKYSK